MPRGGARPEHRSLGRASVSETGAQPVRPMEDGADTRPSAGASPTGWVDAVPRLGLRPSLDGLRGVAVLLVVLIHTGDSLWPEADAWLARGGALGVHLFFVLSGFLITTVLLGEVGRTGGIRLGAFAGRRARRLVPALVALLAVLVAVAATGTRITAGRSRRRPATRCRSRPTTWPAGRRSRWSPGSGASGRCCSRRCTPGRWRSRCSSTCCGPCASGWRCASAGATGASLR